MELNESDISALLKALTFAAHKHRNQRRKGKEVTPYINHPVQVAEILWRVGRVRDVVTFIAALLHDTLEDTDTTPEELQSLFGEAVSGLVQEVSVDKSLPRDVRKSLQIEKAAEISICAQQIKLADKIHNVIDTTNSPPLGWSLQARADYLDWSEKVVAALRGCNADLESHYDAALAEARSRLAKEEVAELRNNRSLDELGHD